MPTEKLGLNTEDTNGAEETDPFSADMVKNLILPTQSLTFLAREHSRQ